MLKKSLVMAFFLASLVMVKRVKADDTFSLTYGNLSIAIMKPTSATRYYKGVRFSNVALVEQATYNGHQYLYHPTVPSSASGFAAGLPQEFDEGNMESSGLEALDPPGFSLTKGSNFLKIGVGLLENDLEDTPYEYDHDYPVVEPSTTLYDVTSPTTVKFYQVSPPTSASNGYGYKLVEYVQLSEGNKLTFTSTLTNIGQKPFSTEQSIDNLLLFDNQMVGTSPYTVTFPYPLAISSDPTVPYTVSGQTISFPSALQKSSKPRIFLAAGYNDSLVVQNPSLNMSANIAINVLSSDSGVTYRSNNEGLYQAPVGLFLAPEDYWIFSLPAYKSITYSRTYSFSAPAKAGSNPYIVPNFEKSFSIDNGFHVAGSPTQMAFGPDHRLYVMMDNEKGVYSYRYSNGVLSDEKLAVTNVSGPGISFYKNAMYCDTDDSFFNGQIIKMTDANGDGIWGDTAHGDLRVSIVSGILEGDHPMDQIQITPQGALYVGIGRRTVNGHTGPYTASSFSDVPGESGFGDGGTGTTFGDFALGGCIATIQSLDAVPNVVGAANSYANTAFSQSYVQQDASPLVNRSNNKLIVHSAGTRNPFGLALDASENLWFTNNFNRALTHGNGTWTDGFRDANFSYFGQMVSDQLFKASSGADYGYSDDNWRGKTPMLTPGSKGYHLVKSLTFDNLYNPGPYPESDPQSPNGLGPDASADGLCFFYSASLPAALQNSLFLCRWSGDIPEALGNTNNTINYQDLVAVNWLTGKVTPFAAGFSNPLCVLDGGDGHLIVGDYSGIGGSTPSLWVIKPTSNAVP